MKNSQTKSVKKKDIKVNWHLVDARDEVLGRMATKIARLLMGKNKQYFSFNQNCGDKVVVVNVSKIKVTGKKKTKKMYYRTSGFMGGLKEESYETLISKKPTEALWKAVYGMLPNNRLRKERMANLYLYVDEKHQHKVNFENRKEVK